jgi:hypothetical protein
VLSIWWNRDCAWVDASWRVHSCSKPWQFQCLSNQL